MKKENSSQAPTSLKASPNQSSDTSDAASFPREHAPRQWRTHTEPGGKETEGLGSVGGLLTRPLATAMKTGGVP